jgi:hypothetical protein
MSEVRTSPGEVMNAYANAATGTFHVLWNIIRAPILVGFICMAVMILGVFTSCTTALSRC